MVKYADGPTAQVEATIAAPRSTVWDLVADINTPASFSEEFQRAEWVDEGGPALGARFTGHNRHEAVGEWSVPCTITAYEPGNVFEWTVGQIENKVARWRFELAETDDGSTLRFSAEMGPGPSGLTPVIERMPDREEAIVAARLAEWTANMTATVDGIKNLAEAAGPNS